MLVRFTKAHINGGFDLNTDRIVAMRTYDYLFSERDGDGPDEFAVQLMLEAPSGGEGRDVEWDDECFLEVMFMDRDDRDAAVARLRELMGYVGI